MRGYPRPITVVTAPASNYDMTALATVKAELNLVSTDANRDAVLARYITACSQAIETYCNRVFAVETLTDSFYPQRDYLNYTLISDQDPLQLSRSPIIAVASVVENSVALTVNVDFQVDAINSRLIRIDSNGYPRPWRALPIIVTYSTGFATLPADVVDACIDFVKFRYFARMRDPSLKSENVVGVYEASYLWGTGPGGPDDMPATVAGKIDRYRVPVIG